MANDIDYPVGFYFSLSFEGEASAFQEVTGITNELSVEEVVSGGENRFKHRLPHMAASQNLVLKRGLVPIGSKLIKWCAGSLDGGLSNTVDMHDVSVRLMSGDNLVLSMWTFNKAYPVNYAVTNLNPQEDTVVVESVELAYAYFTMSGSPGVFPGYDAQKNEGNIL